MGTPNSTPEPPLTPLSREEEKVPCGVRWGAGGACPDSLLCGQMASHLQSPLLPAWPGLVPPQRWQSVLEPCAAWQATPGRQAGGWASGRGDQEHSQASYPILQAPLFWKILGLWGKEHLHPSDH